MTRRPFVLLKYRTRGRRAALWLVRRRIEQDGCLFQTSRRRKCRPNSDGRNSSERVFLLQHKFHIRNRLNTMSISNPFFQIFARSHRSWTLLVTVPHSSAASRTSPEYEVGGREGRVAPGAAKLSSSFEVAAHKEVAPQHLRRAPAAQRAFSCEVPAVRLRGSDGEPAVASARRQQGADRFAVPYSFRTRCPGASARRR